MAKELKDCMTSELLFQAGICTNEAEKATYLSEYERRLKFMGLTDEVIQKFREADQAAINNGCYIKANELLSTKPFIEPSMDINSIKMENCTFSELIYLTDDANSAYFRNHHWLPEKAWALVCEHALYARQCKAAFEARNRMEAIGVTREQESLFTKHECLIAQRLRWHYTTELAWY